ncbi:hypothetical protein MD484_g6790, partial [Candolleomyces efflorescens]
MSEPNIGSSYFHGAQNTTVHGGIRNMNIERDMHVYNHHHHGRSQNGVKDLQRQIAAGAMHDSAERCDAPKCHPETRVAVQGELVDWIEQGEQEENPKKIVWVTGPAGGGKTAIMGTTADTCHKKGLLACGFFFSSFAQSVNRRYKRCLIPTLAYQLVQHDALPGVGDRILSCVECNPAIFDRQLGVQLDQLLLRPLIEGRSGEGVNIPKVIFIDGLDECQAEDRGNITRSRDEATLANEADQTEILHTLLKASKDPSFPFRFIIASRPEPAIQSFFTDTAHDITKKIFLDNKYNPDADMLLFVEARFDAIRRQCHLPTSWPPEDVKHTLVENASGQFVYVATAMRFLEGSSGPPQKLLDQIMNLGCHDVSTNPFALLDALYTHILNSSPEPLLAARWVSAIFRTQILYNCRTRSSIPEQPSARFTQKFLESSPGEASYVLRGLSSLVSIPSPNDHTSPFTLFHKSLTDFLENRSRCTSSTSVFSNLRQYFPSSNSMIADKGPATQLSEREKGVFLRQFFKLSVLPDPELFGENFELYDVAWWVRSQDELRRHSSCEDSNHYVRCVRELFSGIHSSCIGVCSSVCKHIRTEMLVELQVLGWETPSWKSETNTWNFLRSSPRLIDGGANDICPPMARSTSPPKYFQPPRGFTASVNNGQRLFENEPLKPDIFGAWQTSKREADPPRVRVLETWENTARWHL